MTKSQMIIYQFKNGFYFDSIDSKVTTVNKQEIVNHFMKTDEPNKNLRYKKTVQDELLATLINPSHLFKNPISVEEYNKLTSPIKDNYILTKSEEREVMVPLTDIYDVKMEDLTKINYFTKSYYSDIKINRELIKKNLINELPYSIFEIIKPYFPCKLDVYSFLVSLAKTVSDLKLDNYFNNHSRYSFSINPWDHSIEIKDYGKPYNNEFGRREIRKQNGQSYAKKRYVPIRITPNLVSLKKINFDSLDLTGNNFFTLTEKINAIIDCVFGKYAEDIKNEIR